MKKILNILLLSGAIVAFNACERDLDSENITKGTIRFPSVIINGSETVTIQEGDDYTDAGAEAFLGEDNVTSELVTEGTVDENTPGVYILSYTVSTTNELGEQSVVTANRFVNVTSEDISDVDLSGNYRGVGFSANPRTVPVTRIAPGWYTITDVLSSGNGIAAVFAHTGGNNIVIPDQATGFGNVNTTADGAEATLTPAGFTWTVFVGCCGNFGPVVFTKQ